MNYRDAPSRSFAQEDLDYFRALLYEVNMSAPCMNPPHPSWVKAYQNASFTRSDETETKQKD